MKTKNLLWAQITVIALLLLSSHFKYGIAHSSGNLTFSAFGFMPPLVCLFFSIKATSLLVLALIVVKFCGFKLFVTMGLPTIASIMAWRSFHGSSLWSQFFIMVLLPIGSIFAFIIHPIGSQAQAYAMYWFIPIGAFLIRNYVTGLFKVISIAAASTFVCHAVGSILWLYSVPSTPQFWIALIPIVFWERLVMMSGMTIVYIVGVLTLQRNVADPNAQAILLGRRVVRRYLMWRV